MGRFEINSRKPSKNPKTGNRVLFDHVSTGGEKTDNEPNEWVFRPLRQESEKNPSQVCTEWRLTTRPWKAGPNSLTITLTLADDQFDLSWVAK